MKQREANFELLRIVAMLMILTLHYLDKGGILPGVDETFSLTGYLAWGLEALCVCAVDVYVLIGAYFLACQEYRPQRAVRIWKQTLFYAVGIAAVYYAAALGTGALRLDSLDPYALLHDLFPVVTEHYWFATAYILMTLLAPLMNEGLKKLPPERYRLGVCLLLLILSLAPSVLPVTLETDRAGYDALWFLCLYLIGAYLRYRETEEANPAKDGFWRRHPFPCYLACCAAIFAFLVILHAFYEKTGKLASYGVRQYQYNSVLCLASAVCLFLAFRRLRIRDGYLAAAIRKLAGASFGVYLIHEHACVRYVWNRWLHTRELADTPLFLPHWAASVALAYTACACIELGRQRLFAAIGRRRKEGSGYGQD